MSEKSQKRRDFLQNITIVLLSLSAVFLFARTQFNSLGTGLLPFLSGGDLPAGAPPVAQEKPVLVSPVRVAVSGPFGRYGSITLITASEDFSTLRSLLEQALAGAGTYTAGDSGLFLDALGQTSVYYDFLNPLPLSVLAGMLQGTSQEPLAPRRLLVARRGTGVALYLWNEDGACYWSETSLSPEVLEETVNRYELGNASFAFESQEPSAKAVDPCSLFLETLPELPRLTVSVPLPDTNLLLTKLGFNPNTQNRYVDGSGAEVVMEGSRSLRLRPDGGIVYQSGGDPALSIPSSGEIPTRLEAATEVSAMLDGLLSAVSKDASLYLESVRQVGGATVLNFGYQSGGVPIRFADGRNAAQVSLNGCCVSSLTLQIRQYTAGAENTLMLPLRQALAIAARNEGMELFVGYTDSGDGAADATWLAE